MKKTFKVVSLVALVAIFIASCKPDQTNEVAVNGSATISGTAYVDLDLTNDTIGDNLKDYEKAPSGTVIYAKINSEDLVFDPAGGMNYADIYYTTTVEGNGAFSFTIDANSKMVDVIFSADDFKANQTQPDSTVESKVFEMPTNVYIESVYEGVTKITNVFFELK